MVNNLRAGQIAQQSDLINLGQLVAQYYALKPDANQIEQAVQFGTSGHRGVSSNHSFNENHILAITQAIVDYRRSQHINGPCFVGKDTHALSEPAFISVLEVLSANAITVIVEQQNGFTPTPSISHAILCHNQQKKSIADGIIITPSHNGPDNGGIKYNLINGGPSDTGTTQIIEQRANKILINNLKEVKRISLNRAWQSGFIKEQDLISDYVEQLGTVVDMSSIQHSGLTMGVDPLGGAGIVYWQKIAERYKLNLTLVNDQIDPSFRFMHLDYDGCIRMDCSSPYVMTGLLALRNRFDLTFANDPDHDRHGIVTQQGLMAPNHYLSVAINYLFKHRPYWAKEIAVGKTLVSSAMIDCIVTDLGRDLIEVPVGFKWFVDDLFTGKIGFAGEESAGASFLKFDGTPWSTDKDGIIMCLLAAEIMAVTKEHLPTHYASISTRFGSSSYNRIQAPATEAQKKTLLTLNPEMIKTDVLAGDTIIARLTKAPGNGAPIDGLKIVTDKGWFAARPSGTENAYKIYCESLVDDEHRLQIESEAVAIVNTVFANIDN